MYYLYFGVTSFGIITSVFILTSNENPLAHISRIDLQHFKKVEIRFLVKLC